MRSCLTFIHTFERNLCSKHSVSWKATARHLQAIHFLITVLRPAEGTAWGGQALEAAWTWRSFPLTHWNHSVMDGDTATRVQNRVCQPSGQEGNLDYRSTHPGRKDLSSLPSAARVWNHKQHCLRSLASSEVPLIWLRTYTVFISFASLGRSGRRDSLFRRKETRMSLL